MLRRLTGDVPLLLDAAYAEFADEDLTAAALALPRTLVLRTFSKAWGLAGLRVGCLLGPADLLAELRAWGQPYAVAGASLAVARTALATGEAAVNAGVAAARAARADLAARLRRLGAAPLPSQGNFVLCRPRDAAFTGRGPGRPRGRASGPGPATPCWTAACASPAPPTGTRAIVWLSPWTRRWRPRPCCWTWTG